MLRKLDTEFAFAGFDFPRYVGTLPRGDFSKRLERMRKPVTGDYYHAPKPNACGNAFFYLDSDFMPGLRWQWCDDVTRNIHHTGWFCDEYQDGKIRGLVMRLPHGRGFLAGHSMGEGMASTVECFVYASEESAAYAADSMAESAAEDQRNYELENQDAE